MKKTMYIVIGCDTDPDRKSFFDDLPQDSLSWRGMLEGIPLTKKKVSVIKDSHETSPVFSWCLRVDHQIKEYYGRYNHVLETHKSFFEELENDGDELAWHPHFFKFDTETNEWYQEFKDVDWQTTMLQEAHADYMSIFPGRAKSVRMGWDFHNNNTFATLEKLGVQIDFSGIPGLYIQPKHDDIKSVNFFDWSLSPNNPYFAALSDYRRPANTGEESRKILESPNFVSRSMIWSLISGLVFAKKMKDYKQIFRAIKRPVYWICITGKSNLFKPIVKQVTKELKHKDKIFFVTYFHPDELLPNKTSLYSLDFMLENLNMLVTTVKNTGAAVEFIKASEIQNKLNH